MNGKIAKKIRRYHNKSISKQLSFIHSSLKPFPKNVILYKLWIIFARYYFTEDHINLIKKIRNENKHKIKGVTKTAKR